MKLIIQQVYQLILTEIFSTLFGEPTKELTKREKIMLLSGIIIGLLIASAG